VVLTKSIISHSAEGGSLQCGYSLQRADVTVTCCDIFGNVGGDWISCIAWQYGVDGNISLDPMYCGDDSPSQPYSLREGSPCLPENNVCGVLIGALGVGCSPTPVEAKTWGAIKAMFR
jgi:hypothetical protein